MNIIFLYKKKVFVISSIFLLAFNFASKNSFAQNNEDIITETFGYWEKICNKDKVNCVGSQFALDSSGKRIGRIVVSKANENEKNIASIVNIFFPFETSTINLRSGLLITVDQLEPLKENFFYCDKKGCNARIQFSNMGNQALINGSNLTIKFLDIGKNNTIQVLDVSLLDYNNMFKSLEN